MDKINEYTVDDPKQKREIIYILNDIEGQIRGNKLLRENCGEILMKISNYTSDARKLTFEPMKRNLVSELRENLRNLNLETYNKLLRSQQ